MKIIYILWELVGFELFFKLYHHHHQLVFLNKLRSFHVHLNWL